jgi:hypothetical protein
VCGNTTINWFGTSDISVAWSKTACSINVGWLAMQPRRNLLCLWIKPITIFLDLVHTDLLHIFGFEILTWDLKMGDPVMITDSSYSKWANVWDSSISWNFLCKTLKKATFMCGHDFCSCKCWPHLCIFGCPENSILFTEYNCQTFQFLAFVTASLCSSCFMPFVVDHLLLKSQTSEFCQHRQAGWDLRFKQLLEQFMSQVYTIFCQNCYNTGRRELVLYLYWDIVCVTPEKGWASNWIYYETLVYWSFRK